MLVKILVSIVLVSSASIVGYLISLRYSLRVKELCYLQAALNNLGTEIIYYSNSLPLAMKKISERTHESIAGFFGDTYELLESKEGLRIEEAWESSILKNFRMTSLHKEDIQIIIDFGKDLGIGDKDTQKKHFDYVRVLLEEQRCKAIAEKESSGNMYKKLGFLMGLVLVIILI